MFRRARLMQDAGTLRARIRSGQWRAARARRAAVARLNTPALLVAASVAGILVGRIGPIAARLPRLVRLTLRRLALVRAARAVKQAMEAA